MWKEQTIVYSGRYLCATRTDKNQSTECQDRRAEPETTASGRPWPRTTSWLQERLNAMRRTIRNLKSELAFTSGISAASSSSRRSLIRLWHGSSNSPCLLRVQFFFYEKASSPAGSTRQTVAAKKMERFDVQDPKVGSPDRP
jgi:hypothetical protein